MGTSTGEFFAASLRHSNEAKDTAAMSVITIQDPTIDQSRPFISSSSRLDALDNLRSLTIVLVVVFHASMSYMLFAPTWWYVVDTKQSLGFFCFVMICDVFIMPVMFLLAGYFGLPSLLRKGEDAFAREKLKRIGIPWVVGTLFFAPVTTYFIWLSRTRTPPPYLHFWTHTFFSTYFEQAQFWFLGVLLLFYFGLMIARSANEQLKWFEPGTGRPSLWFFPGFVALTSLAFMVVNQHVNDYAWVSVSYLLVIQPTRFSLYIFFFALGVHGYRRRWFTANGYNPRIAAWLPLSLVLGAAFMLYKLRFGLKLDQFRYRAGNDVLHLRLLPGCCVRADRGLPEIPESHLEVLAQPFQKFVCDLLRAHGDRATAGNADQAASVEHHGEVYCDVNLGVSDFVSGLGVRGLQDAAVCRGQGLGGRG
jgi:glucans biosynthesis protein C